MLSSDTTSAARRYSRGKMTSNTRESPTGNLSVYAHVPHGGRDTPSAVHADPAQYRSRPDTFSHRSMTNKLNVPFGHRRLVGTALVGRYHLQLRTCIGAMNRSPALNSHRNLNPLGPIGLRL